MAANAEITLWVKFDGRVTEITVKAASNRRLHVDALRTACRNPENFHGLQNVSKADLDVYLNDEPTTQALEEDLLLSDLPPNSGQSKRTALVLKVARPPPDATGPQLVDEHSLTARVRDALSALVSDGFESEGGHELACRLASYLGNGDDTLLASTQNALTDSSFSAHDAEIDSRASSVDDMFSRFRPSAAEIDLRPILNGQWLALLEHCPVDAIVLASLAKQLETYQRALAYLKSLSSARRGLSEKHVVHPLVALWVKHLAEALFGLGATIAIFKGAKSHVTLPNGTVASGDADRVVTIEDKLAAVIEVKRPFDTFRGKGSAAKDQLLIELACYGAVYDRKVIAGFVTDLFRLNVAIHVRPTPPVEAQVPWTMYECRTRFQDPVGLTAAALCVLASGFAEKFPEFDPALVTLLQTEPQPTRRSERLRRPPCMYGAFVQQNDDDDCSDSEPDDRLPVRQDTQGAPPKATSKQAEPAGPSQPQGSRSQQKNTTATAFQRPQYKIVAEPMHRKSLMDLNTGTRFQVVPATASELRALEQA